MPDLSLALWLDLRTPHTPCDVAHSLAWAAVGGDASVSPVTICHHMRGSILCQSRREERIRTWFQRAFRRRHRDCRKGYCDKARMIQGCSLLDNTVLSSMSGTEDGTSTGHWPVSLASPMRVTQ